MCRMLGVHEAGGVTLLGASKSWIRHSRWNASTDHLLELQFVYCMDSWVGCEVEGQTIRGRNTAVFTTIMWHQLPSRPARRSCQLLVAARRGQAQSSTGTAGCCCCTADNRCGGHCRSTGAVGTADQQVWWAAQGRSQHYKHMARGGGCRAQRWWAVRGAQVGWAAQVYH